jgi:hypothetical protein
MIDMLAACVANLDCICILRRFRCCLSQYAAGEGEDEYRLDTWELLIGVQGRKHGKLERV